MTARIEGESLAAAAVGQLLGLGELGGARPASPVMIGTQTRQLLADVFPSDRVAGLWPIERRTVRWGTAPEQTFPHRAWVMTQAPMPPAPTTGDFVIHAGGPSGVTFTSFGQRQARATLIAHQDDPHACRIESKEAGWSFLLPISKQEAWLIEVGDHDDATFSCSPRIATELTGANWLRCGSAAAGFDPLCGDGVGHALREAILAAAVIKAGARPEHLAHYERQLRAGLARHLEICAGFYATGGDGAWWRQQEEAARAGAASLQPNGAPRFRLNGFELEPIL